MLPSVREWRGGNGEFVFSGVIICEDDSLLNAAKQFELYISEMTGSGSVVFGVFENENKAIEAKNTLSKKYKSVFIARPTDCGVYVLER